MSRRPVDEPRSRRLGVVVASAAGVVCAAALVAGLVAGAVELPGTRATAAGASSPSGPTGPGGGELAPPDGAAEDLAAARRAEQAARAAAEREERARAAEEARETAEREAQEQEREEQEREEQERVEEEARQAEEREAQEAAEREAQARAALVDAQQRLVDLGYLVGAVDGEQGQQTTAALMAFQAVNGLQVDGVLGPVTTEALAAPRGEPSLAGGAATRIEVDLDLQVLHLVEDGQRVVTMKVSSGNGAPYTRGDGSTNTANTPVGDFRIQRRIAGVRESSAGLGTLYDPMYFLGGFAIHGSNSVPAGPASHGCVRVSRADAVWLFDRVPDGTPVQLRGGTHTFTT